MEVVQIKCDNPKCKKMGDSESYDSPKPGEWLPPYGWLLVPSASYFGSGPTVERIIVCSAGCLGPAVEAAFRLAYEQERTR